MANITVYFLDKKSKKRKKLFWKRGVRILPNKRAGINYKGNVYTLFKGNQFNIDAPKHHLFKLDECKLASSKEVEELLNNLPDYDEDSYEQTGTELIEESLYEIKSPALEEKGQARCSIEGDAVIPTEVYTDPVSSVITDLDGKKWDLIQINRIHYRELSIPQFETEWFIERTDWFAYVLVNNDSIEVTDEQDHVFETVHLRLDAIREILQNPEYYLLPRSAFFKQISHSYDQHEALNKAKYLGEIIDCICKTPFKEVMLNKSTSLETSKTFYDKWNRIEFEDRASIRLSTNGIQYDHWFRFDLSISDESLKSMFKDIFEIYQWEGMQFYSAIEADYRTPPSLPNFCYVQPTVYESRPEIKQRQRDNEADEWIEELEKENTEINEEIRNLRAVNKELNEDKIRLSSKVNNLSQEIRKIKSFESTRIENNLKLFFGNAIVFLPAGIKTLKSFSKPDKFYEILRDLLIDELNIPKKKAERTDNWIEIDKKISTGGDDQGRIYYSKTGRDDRKYIVLIGNKQNQKQDIEYLRRDHKKDLDM